MSVVILRKRGYGKEYLPTIAALIPDCTVTTHSNRVPNNAIIIRWAGADLPANATDVINGDLGTSSNKGRFRMLLQDNGVSVPRTCNYLPELLDRFQDSRTWIIRPNAHAAGRNLYTAQLAADAERITERLGTWYASAYIEKDREFRVFVVSGRVIGVAEKIVENRTQIAWNNAFGGHFKNLKFGEWPIKACVEAVKAFNLSQLDFGAVDVIQKDETPYVLEINAAPSITSRYRQETFAKALAWLVGGQDTPAVLPDRVRGWRRLVHPAISNECRSD